MSRGGGEEKKVIGIPYLIFRKNGGCVDHLVSFSSVFCNLQLLEESGSGIF